jgi:hypothetical protein
MMTAGLLLGLSFAFVGTLSLGSVLVVSWVLPDSPGSAVTRPATPEPKPASSDAPSRSLPAREDISTKKRNG